MPQNVPIRTTGQAWAQLEPAMVPEYARTDHGKLKAAGAGLFITYAKGQVVRQKDNGTNEFAIDGTAGYTGPARLMKHTTIVNDAGQMQLGTTWFTNGGEIFEGSTDMYYRGYFFCQDLIGTKDETLGKLVRGTYVTGMLALNEGTPVAAA